MLLSSCNVYVFSISPLLLGEKRNIHGAGSAKMGIAQAHSRQMFTPKGIVEPDKLRNIPAPWELETFVENRRTLFCIRVIDGTRRNFKSSV